MFGWALTGLSRPCRERESLDRPSGDGAPGWRRGYQNPLYLCAFVRRNALGHAFRKAGRRIPISPPQHFFWGRRSPLGRKKGAVVFGFGLLFGPKKKSGAPQPPFFEQKKSGPFFARTSFLRPHGGLSGEDGGDLRPLRSRHSKGRAQKLPGEEMSVPGIRLSCPKLK